MSLDVDPRLARDTEKTTAQAVELWKIVDRPNVMIKIPATEAGGLAAITRTLAEGISINVTLIFSVERYRAVMEAFLDGLEQAKAHGHDLSTIASVASFFVSRVDTEIDKRLTAIDSGIDHWGDRSFRRYGRTASPAEHVRVRDSAGHRVIDWDGAEAPGAVLGRLRPGFVLKRDAKLCPIRDPAVLC